MAKGTSENREEEGHSGANLSSALREVREGSHGQGGSDEEEGKGGLSRGGMKENLRGGLGCQLLTPSAVLGRVMGSREDEASLGTN